MKQDDDFSWEDALTFPCLFKTHRQMTDEELVAVKCIREQVTLVGRWEKKFMRQLGYKITEKQAAQVWRIFKRYRRQIQHERKAELLEIAERLGAPEMSRKAGTQLT